MGGEVIEAGVVVVATAAVGEGRTGVGHNNDNTASFCFVKYIAYRKINLTLFLLRHEPCSSSLLETFSLCHSLRH